MESIESALSTMATVNQSDDLLTTTPESCFWMRPPMTEVRFWVVTVFGSTISVISMMENALLFYLFSSRKHHRTNHNMYMMFLAFFDFFVSAAYVCLMSMNVLGDWLISPFLVRIWFFYMVPMITISHIAMTSASFLIVAASFERYCMTVNSPYLSFAQRNRKLIVGFAILLGIISKGTICLEYEIHHPPECEGLMSEYQLAYRDFVFETPYHVVWRFWYRNFVTIFAPFFILAYLNMRIVKALTAQQQMTICQLAGNAAIEIAKRKSMANLNHEQAVEYTKRKVAARAATRSLVLVVCCYLISNIINVILTIWEYFDKASLDGEFMDIYAVAIDAVSLLTTMACFFRLPILMACQLQIRQEVIEIVKNLIWCSVHKKIDEGGEHLFNSGGSSQGYTHNEKESVDNERKLTEGRGVTFRIPPDPNHNTAQRIEDDSSLQSKHISMEDEVRMYYPMGSETLL